jgi:hypothetical protein
MTQPMHSDRPDAAGPTPAADAPGLEEEQAADAATEAGPGEPGTPDTDEPTSEDGN